MNHYYKGVIEKINKITRQFLWCGDKEKKSLSLVSWDIVQAPKNQGGLGIGNFLHKNLAMLFKWIWRYFKDPNQFWCRAVKSKYMYSSTISIVNLSVPNHGGPWKHICAAIFNHTNAKSVMINGVRKNIGKGLSTFFWQDPWLLDRPLKTEYPRLYSIAIDGWASVES